MDYFRSAFGPVETCLRNNGTDELMSLEAYASQTCEMGQEWHLALGLLSIAFRSSRKFNSPKGWVTHHIHRQVWGFPSDSLQGQWRYFGMRTVPGRNSKGWVTHRIHRQVRGFPSGSLQGQWRYLGMRTVAGAGALFNRLVYSPHPSTGVGVYQ